MVFAAMIRHINFRQTICVLAVVLGIPALLVFILSRNPPPDPMDPTTPLPHNLSATWGRR